MRGFVSLEGFRLEVFQFFFYLPPAGNNPPLGVFMWMRFIVLCVNPFFFSFFFQRGGGGGGREGKRKPLSSYTRQGPIPSHPNMRASHHTGRTENHHNAMGKPDVHLG
eukprot:TRINITY_DN7254_c0_g1_i1.p1 TRINITY_DN7254_c0_g1~~TRINITY_DN7254_c0_g1_i1.p1  ORF type:complete len:108 (-),score=1.99 TRINITY_DN7254_c0_g1_i1:84-407(-)